MYKFSLLIVNFIFAGKFLSTAFTLHSVSSKDVNRMLRSLDKVYMAVHITHE